MELLYNINICILKARKEIFMLILDDLKQTLVSFEPKLKELYTVLAIEDKKQQLKDLEDQSAGADFWNDAENSHKVLKKISSLKSIITKYDKLKEKFDDIGVMIELAAEEDDESILAEIKTDLDEFTKNVDELTLATLLTGQYDANSVILTLHAGAGGTEAQDWTEMLMRMYQHWADAHGYKTTVLDTLDGNDAGIKMASMMIEGENAYGYLKSEAGIHRLVRISPFDASGSRHTSFAAVDVMPEIDDDIEVEIRPEDIKMDVFRSSGAGGQHINKTSSAVRLTHIPTGIVTSCQTQRSQVQNRDFAMKMLKSKLMAIKEAEHLATIADIKGVQKEIAWGSQIRSYVFMPYTLVKDHRTGYEQGNVNGVMDGDLDGFINAYLKALSLGQIEK